ncbi:MAG: glycosyltransferase family 4 protein [Candidatus Omnitrophica bacterium]|nr:glycosyltransferase family 4 protein [Candidatus Omnitrophota bacterium]MDD5736723.1 glycosyltransferase family 4 protein [Candidatus Omnitrophota bacterium]
MENINLIIWTGNTLTGGVDVWVKELRARLRGSRYNLITISDGYTFAGDEKVDIYIHSWGQLRRTLKRLSPAVVMPNWRHKIFGICAKLNEEGAHLRCIGACHSDSAEEYYGPLAWYESAISGFMAVSDGCARSLAGYIPHRKGDIELITYGITVPARQDKAYSLRPLRIVYFGRIDEKQKNASGLLEAAGLLDKRGTAFTLDIIGSGPDRRALACAARKMRLSCGKARLLGQVSRAELLKKLGGYDVFLQVSKYEGQSVSMLEAMAARLIPCVTRASGGGWRVIEDGINGFTAGTGNAEAMAQILDNVAKMDKARASAIGIAARRTVEDRFDIGKNISAFTGLVDKCSEAAVRRWARGNIYSMPGGWNLNYLPDNEIAGIAMKAAFRIVPRVKLRHFAHRIAKGA